MNKTKEKHATFTPGPWMISCIDGVEDSLMVGGGDDGSDIVADIREEANARLIAAAPAMYEVLQELAESMELAKNYGYEKEHAMIQEILAKVEGGEG
jgi:hypothetical protein